MGLLSDLMDFRAARKAPPEGSLQLADGGAPRAPAEEALAATIALTADTKTCSAKSENQ